MNVMAVEINQNEINPTRSEYAHTPGLNSHDIKTEIKYKMTKFITEAITYFILKSPFHIR